MPTPSNKRKQPASAPYPDFYIGPIPIYGRLALAPMDGISDHPYRVICRQMGSAFSVTEFISTTDAPKFQKDIARRAAFLPAERPIGFQLYGSEPRQFLEAALRLREEEPDFFYINLGCSVRAITNSGRGAGLLRRPDTIREIFSCLTKNLDIPITAKIRLGWDTASRNFLETCRILQDNGAAMITVHGRTANDGWKQPAEWTPIAEVKRAMKIPVIGNGDIWTNHDIDTMFSETGCDGVMVGRAALGNPWIFSWQEKCDIPRDEILRVAQTHWQRMDEFYGEELAWQKFRKYIKAYCNGPAFDAIRVRAILECPHPVNLPASLG